MTQPRVYVALDTSELGRAIGLARQVDDLEGDFGYKVNLDLLLTEGGPRTVAEISALGRPVFADTKTWNGGRTMAEVAIALGRAGAALVNVYAHAGVRFMTGVVERLRDDGADVEVYALGILTHCTEADCRRLYRRTMAEAVRFFAEEAVAAGVHGYIQPGPHLGETASLDIRKLVPGVRPAWFADTKANAQEQTCTPADAVTRGASTIVVGSPIFSSPDPADALRRILAETTS